MSETIIWRQGANLADPQADGVGQANTRELGFHAVPHGKIMVLPSFSVEGLTPGWTKRETKQLLVTLLQSLVD